MGIFSNSKNIVFGSKAMKGAANAKGMQNSQAMKELLSNKKVAKILDKKSEQMEFYKALKEKESGGGVTKNEVRQVLGKFRKGGGKNIDKNETMGLADELIGKGIFVKRYLFEKGGGAAQGKNAAPSTGKTPVKNINSFIASKMAPVQNAPSEPVANPAPGIGSVLTGSGHQPIDDLKEELSNLGQEAVMPAIESGDQTLPAGDPPAKNINPSITNQMASAQPMPDKPILPIGTPPANNKTIPSIANKMASTQPMPDEPMSDKPILPIGTPPANNKTIPSIANKMAYSQPVSSEPAADVATEAGSSLDGGHQPIDDLAEEVSNLGQEAIMPVIENEPKKKNIVLGLIGEKGGGKGTVAGYIMGKFAASHYEVSKILTKVLENLHIEQSRENYGTLAVILKEGFGSPVLINALLLEMEKDDSPVIIADGIRMYGDVDPFRKKYGKNFHLVYVTADVHVRYERTKARGEKAGESNATFNQFMEEENGTTEKAIRDIGKGADFRLTNNGNPEELNSQIEVMMDKIMDKKKDV